MTQRLVITGASGFIGRQLVPRLQARGIELVLVGRDRKRLKTFFPGVCACSYGEIADNAREYDVLVHLAVLNNDQSASAEAFDKANVQLLCDVVGEAKLAGIKTFVNVTTFHALEEGRSEYAKSKRRALELLEGIDGIKIISLFLPAVYGDDYAGKLRIIKSLPSPLRPGALTVLASMVPTLHADRLTNFLAEGIKTAEQPTLLANPQNNNPVYRTGKRSLDVFFALAVIGLFWWLLAAIWVAVRLESSGPGIFKQERVGRYGKHFICYKFRTMRLGTKQAGTHEVPRGAVTPIGKILRRTKIDELPQVWNILRGELSLVGPRPCLPSQQALTAARKELGVSGILPGITGLSQVNDVDMSDPYKLAKMDALYTVKRGLVLDAKIVFLTFIGAGRGDNTTN